MIDLIDHFDKYSSKSLLLVLLTVVTFLLILFVKAKYNKYYNVWKSQGLPGPSPIPILGSVIDFYFYNFATLQLLRANKYGRNYGLYEGFKPTLATADANLVKQVCVKNCQTFVNRRFFENIGELFEKTMFNARDENWKRLRKIISPTFTTGKLKRMKPLIDRCVRNATDYLETVAERKEEIKLKEFWSRYTLEVIACCCFATQVNSHKDPNNEFFKYVTSFFRSPSLKRRIMTALFLTLPPPIFKLLPANDIFQNETTEYLKNVVIQLLKKRKEKNGNYNDFLQLLIEAEDEGAKTDKCLSEAEIFSNCILFFLAGYETTATMLMYCFYCLATNSEVQEKLYTEIKSHFKFGDHIDYDIANKLPLLDAVICETLRMFPPVLFTEREASAEIVMDDINVKIPKKAAVNIQVYAIHHDPEYYPEPEKFKPERFLGDNRDQINPYTYLPFGLGPRNCVGNRFALIEAKLAIIQTVAKFKFVKNQRTVKPQFAKFTTFLLCEELYVDVVNRS